MESFDGKLVEASNYPWIKIQKSICHFPDWYVGHVNIDTSFIISDEDEGFICLNDMKD
jgi:hypothetical protein